ncbi:alpha-glutamyl/putrescinyl thymine pyrophosphorylase clade 3 protein [Prosthecodimorpha staleyi]|uniref:Alpha-glutamyl/putrescinyl thymine pyrophosphorylase clade 3 domain-containing protein n=1 Tax=Prosthecodimorpha staleyi TaxID=2840188 RepID=A0A947DAS2_9HYPH|nr:hypothetical protein [Prosthecodimorpha staleyi]MBT9290399.1 hypothetical protein [Prosthecodimorpha staleyi]
MWPSRENRRQALMQAMRQHSNHVRPLPGIGDPNACEVLATQFVASERREDYYKRLRSRAISADRADPNHPSFDAERAVVYHIQIGNVEEAAWLIFLMTHFAKPADSGWLRLRQVYGELGSGVWSWARVSAAPNRFLTWIEANWENIGGKFGNHRKYESLDPEANRSFRRVLTDYLAWIGPAGHLSFFGNAVRIAGNAPGTIFDYLYRDMAVISFGRLAKFDYLSLLARYEIVPMHPSSAYFSGATGPVRGARLLFDGNPESPTSSARLQSYVDALDIDIQVGMQVMEDALCNWQKSPTHFVHFLG